MFNNPNNNTIRIYYVSRSINNFDNVYLNSVNVIECSGVSEGVIMGLTGFGLNEPYDLVCPYKIDY